jgi:hypothetical protein
MYAIARSDRMRVPLPRVGLGVVVNVRGLTL